MQRDYLPNPELDQYEEEGMDEEDYDNLNYEQR